MHEHIIRWFLDSGLGLSLPAATILTLGVGVLAAAVLAFIANLITKRLLLRAVGYFISRTATKLDDALLKRSVFTRLSHLAPALILYHLTPVVFSPYPAASSILLRLTLIYMIIVGLLAFDALISAANDIYSTFETSRQIPLRGFFQVLKVVAYCVCGITVVAILMDKTPLYLLSGLGAITAVLLIVFKDPILGFVGGIQLSANKMVAIGDWISMPSHKADGDVIDIALTTVKVQNWDKTITTIPTYDLISRPFKNWQGMQQTGGRRICRSISIDLGTIKLCDEELLARLDKIQHLQGYLAAKRSEISSYNDEHKVDPSSLINGRRLTNVGTFRAYVLAYLRSLPTLRKDMTFLVRHLAPTEHGLPIQIYVFTDTVAWEKYEEIQADIFDHLLAVVPHFDLQLFQVPSGKDIEQGLSRLGK